MGKSVMQQWNTWSRTTLRRYGSHTLDQRVTAPVSLDMLPAKSIRMVFPSCARPSTIVRTGYSLRRLVMSDSDVFDSALGLADFLSDLRAELADAAKRAEHDSLKLGVEEVTVSLDVAVTIAKTGEASAKATAKFWVFASAEAGVKGGLSSERATTQHLTLTLKPRTEEVIMDETGQAHVIRRGVDVIGAIMAGEERPDLPVPKPDEQ
jgi:hypothetical protein